MDYCARPSCLDASAELIGKMNASYDPCGDFWQFCKYKNNS